MARLVAVVAILASVGHSQGTSVSLQSIFRKATSGVAPPELDTADLTRNFTAEAVLAYMKELQSRLDFNEYNSVKATSQPTTNLFKGVQHIAQNLDDSASATVFDDILKGYATIYRRLAALVKGGEDSGMAPITQQTAPTNESAWKTLWTPEDAYIRMPEIVTAELHRLRDWIVAFVDVGIEAAIRELPAMLSEYRKEILYPEVKSAQHTASTLEERYGEALKSYSSPGVWSDYEEARKILSAIHLMSRR
ncbi:uncharacterized protein LOC126094758 [Schistocerca cancellata]|uniref:uncharacterized protein LOC126094758 n=1 Tax=Schistocerca cancellata TaxID=274614 RepID=UPI002118E3FB|nr:uncharacterized protein LOC126094758 [Schistocerca cancellata]